MSRSEIVEINEVVLRDGLQNELGFIATDDKIRLADTLSLSGIRRLEVSSFVSPKAIPNLRDATEVFAAITRLPMCATQRLCQICAVRNARWQARSMKSTLSCPSAKSTIWQICESVRAVTGPVRGDYGPYRGQRDFC